MNHFVVEPLEIVPKCLIELGERINDAVTDFLERKLRLERFVGGLIEHYAGNFPL